MIKYLLDKLFRRQQIISFNAYMPMLQSWVIDRIHETEQEGNEEYTQAIVEEFYEMIDPEYENYEVMFTLKVK